MILDCTGGLLDKAGINQQIRRAAPIINMRVLNAIPSPDYSYKSANKNPITSRPSSGSGRAHFYIK
jgi:hypothetical protein